jgi:flagellar motor switch protein FliM
MSGAAAVDGAARGGRPRRHQRLRTLDFSRPTKFSNDQQRRITRAMETFCQTASTRLSSELRWPLELEILSTSQLTWAAAHSRLASESVPVLVEVDPIGTRMLLSVEQSFVLVCLEALLGGAPERPARDRRMTEIDWSLTARLLGSIIGQLSAVWEEIGGITLRPGEIDPTDAGHVASVSEPTFSMVLECRINQQSFTLTLLVPWIAVEPVANQLSGREPTRRPDGVDHTAPMRGAMSRVKVTLRAEVAAIHLTAEEILALRPGDVVRLGARAEDGVGVFAENTPLARAVPGAAGPRRAVQIRSKLAAR